MSDVCPECDAERFEPCAPNCSIGKERAELRARAARAAVGKSWYFEMVKAEERAERAECEVRRWKRLEKSRWDAGAVPHEVAARLAKHALRYRRLAREHAAWAGGCEDALGGAVLRAERAEALLREALGLIGGGWAWGLYRTKVRDLLGPEVKP